MKEERYQKIMDILSNGEYASVESLSRTLFVSMPTIRRDLNAMQEMGLVTRSHGGVIRRRSENEGGPAYFRMGVNSEVKLRIAREAAKLLRDDCMVFMDESTTTLHIIDHMPQYKNITVITSSMSVLQLTQKYRIRSICLGGEISYDTMSFYGREAEDMIAHYGIDIMFFSSSAVNGRGWISDYCAPANSLRRCALAQSETKVFLCDKSKFLKTSAYMLMPLREADYIIADAPLPAEIASGGIKQIIV